MADPAFLLDSNTCIYIITYGTGSEAKRLGAQRPGSVVTSAIVYAEVANGLHGDEVATTAAESLFDQVPVQPFDDVAAAIYARLPLKRGSFDRLIAAHALSLGLTLVTANTKNFTDIPGLRVEDWTLPR